MKFNKKEFLKVMKLLHKAEEKKRGDLFKTEELKELEEIRKQIIKAYERF